MSLVGFPSLSCWVWPRHAVSSKTSQKGSFPSRKKSTVTLRVSQKKKKKKMDYRVVEASPNGVGKLMRTGERGTRSPSLTNDEKWHFAATIPLTYSHALLPITSLKRCKLFFFFFLLLSPHLFLSILSVRASYQWGTRAFGFSSPLPYRCARVSLCLTREQYLFPNSFPQVK